MQKPSTTSPDVVRLDGVLDFLRLLWDIEHGLQSASKRMEKTLGITGPQRLVLRIVTQFPDVSAGALARTLHLHPSTVTGILQRLVAKRLLVRQPDPSDSRRVRLRALAKAARHTRGSKGTIESAVTSALAEAPVLHVQHARSVLESLAMALDNHRRKDRKGR
jgi:DNA-binding MarR family transcriptional regulator